MSVVQRTQRLRASPRLGRQLSTSFAPKSTGFNYHFTPSMGRVPPGVATAIRASHGSPSPVVVRGASVDTPWVALTALSVATVVAQQARTSVQGGTVDSSGGSVAASSRGPTEAGRQAFLRTLAASPGGEFLGFKSSHLSGGVTAGPIHGASARAYSTSIREGRVKTLAGQVGPDKVVDLGKIMEVLRDLEILDKIKGRQPKSVCPACCDLRCELTRVPTGGNGFKESASSS